MKNTDEPSLETRRPLLPIESLISTFRDAEDAALKASQQLDNCVKRGTDELTIAKLKREILIAEDALYAALQAIYTYQTTSLTEVHQKLRMWHDSTRTDGGATSLSPMEKLVQSAYEDIGRMLAA